MAKDNNNDQDSIWAQSDKDVNVPKGDESLKIFSQMTKGGIVSTETGKKNGGNNRG